LRRSLACPALPLTLAVIIKDHIDKCTSIGLEPRTARFEVQVLGEELGASMRTLFFFPWFEAPSGV
jgi:hypothetical protein